METEDRPNFWASSGLMLLLGALALVLFKTAPSYWPLTLMAFLGSAWIRLWKKKGLIIAYSVLSVAMIRVLYVTSDLMYLIFLSLAIMISWWLIYMGVLETESAESAKAEEKLQLAKLQEQERIAKIALESQTTQLITLQEQYQQLEETLEKTIKELKQMEHEWLCLQKLYELQHQEPSVDTAAFSQNLSQIEEERQALETQVIELEGIISSLLAKKAPPKRRSAADQATLF